MTRTSNILAASSILAALACGAGCSGGKAPTSVGTAAGASAATHPVKVALHVVGRPRAQIASTDIVGIQGSYVGCANHSDGDSWVLDTPGNAGAMEAQTGLSSPAVELGDQFCALEIDDINTAGSSFFSTDSPTTLTFTGPTAAPNNWQESADAFDDGNEQLAFYANAQSSVTDASGDFALTILISADPNSGTSSTTAQQQGPQTCADVLAANATAADGNYNLDIGGDPAKPFTVFCLGMQSGGPPSEYLPLGGGLQNFSEFKAGGLASGSDVVTTYTAVRFDPASLTIHGGDQTFASSAGSLTYGSLAPTTVASMPYGVGMTCNGSASGPASIDLTGTGFEIPAGIFAPGRSGAAGFATYVTNTDVTILAGGTCGWMTGDSGLASDPVNGNDVTLPVVYVGGG